MGNVKRAFAGQKFGRLTALRKDEAANGKHDSLYWFFQCECGTVRSMRYSKVFDGDSQSCGCLQRENSSKFMKKRIGILAPNWQENPDYRAIHNWLRKNFEKQKVCVFCRSADDRTEFALIRGKEYERSRENFVELCVPCHRAYDKETRKLTGKAAYDWKGYRTRAAKPRRHR